MKYKVNKKQLISRDCFVCGTENQAGLKSKFYELENGQIMGIFTPSEHHQSYPNRLHGGVAASILDEIIGRAIKIEDPSAWGVTVELNIKYKKPIPLNNPLKVIAKITRNTRLIFEGTGEIYLEDGSVAATAHGKYVKMNINKISEEIVDADEILIEDTTDGPEEVEI